MHHNLKTVVSISFKNPHSCLNLSLGLLHVQLSFPIASACNQNSIAQIETVRTFIAVNSYVFLVITRHHEVRFEMISEQDFSTASAELVDGLELDENYDRLDVQRET